VKRIIQFLSLIILFQAQLAYAGWAEDVRLTYNNRGSIPDIMARGDTIHVVFANIGPTDSIFYLRSLDAGNFWGQPISLQDAGHLGSQVHINLWNDEILVTWNDIDTNHVNWSHNIPIRLSSLGNEWYPVRYLFRTLVGGEFIEFSSAICGDTIYTVYCWSHSDSTGYRPMIFLRSTDLGQSWGQKETIGYLMNYTNPLQILVCGGRVYIIWSGDFPPEFLGREVHGLASSDGGRNWSEHFLVSSDDHYVAQHSCVACDAENGNLAIGWMDYALSHGYPGDIFVRLTTDGGQSWGDIQHATTSHTASNPSIAIRGDSLYTVWCDNDTEYGYPNSEICFTRSTSFGENWDQPSRLTYAEGYSYTPRISYDMGRLHVAWWEELRPPHNGDEVYYKRYDPEADAIDRDILQNPINFSLSAYPNPFNSATTITLTGAEQAEIGIYDITGRLITTLHTSGGQALWDASAYSSGLYFARATGEKASTIKLILVK
jgi:hypothetical protein